MPGFVANITKTPERAGWSPDFAFWLANIIRQSCHGIDFTWLDGDFWGKEQVPGADGGSGGWIVGLCRSIMAAQGAGTSNHHSTRQM